MSRLSNPDLLEVRRSVWYQEEGTQPPLREPGSVEIWEEFATPPPLPHPPPCCEISDIQPNHILCPGVYCCQLLIEIAGQSDTNFSWKGGGGVDCTLYTHLADPFWVMWLNLRPVAHNQGKPHITPYHSLIYTLHIIGRYMTCGMVLCTDNFLQLVPFS